MNQIICLAEQTADITTVCSYESQIFIFVDAIVEMKQATTTKKSV